MSALRKLVEAKGGLAKATLAAAAHKSTVVAQVTSSGKDWDKGFSKDWDKGWSKDGNR